MNIPNNSNTKATQKVSAEINELMSEITDMQIKVEKPITFLYDVLNDFFDHYEMCKDKDINNLICMWYSVKHYRIYIETVLEYILNLSEQLEQIHNELTITHDMLSGGVA